MINILQCNINIGEETFRFLGNIFSFIQILSIVLVIVLGIIDFVKALATSDTEKMNKNKSNFIKRLIIVVVILLIFGIVKFLIILGVSQEAGECMDCLINPSNCKVSKVKTNTNTEKEKDKNEETYVDDTECKAQFSGVFLTDPQYVTEFSFNKKQDIIFMEEYEGSPEKFPYPISSDILKQGEYYSTCLFIPNSCETTWDSFAVNSNTTLTIYNNENFEGGVKLQVKGPAIYYNVEYYNDDIKGISVDPPFSGMYSKFSKNFTSWKLHGEGDNAYNEDIKTSFKIECD